MADHHQTLTGWLTQALADVAGAGAELLGAVGLRRWLLGRCLPPGREAFAACDCPGAVEVRIDRWGVPHIHAELAGGVFFTQGYCHARDRLWQMELGRRVASGELAELFGERAVDLDRVFRRFAFRRAAETEAAGLDDELRAALTAYAAGVNAYLVRHARPIEFDILGHTPRPWTVVDSLTVARYIAWNLSYGWESKLIRARLVEALGAERAAALEPRLMHPTQAGPLGAGGIAGAAAARQATGLGGGLTGAGGASNAWAVAPDRSATRAALLANDPHLWPRMPAVWYVMHLKGGGYNVAGATMPGLIGVLIGHNEHVAWGITVAIADCQEIYVEKPHPDRPHVFADGPEWYAAEVRQEVIHVRKGMARQETVVRTRHGPLLNGVLDIPVDGPPLCLKSTTDTGTCSTRALLDLNRAVDWPTFRAALAKWTFPTLDFMYADVDGTIATKRVGRVPIQPMGDGLPVTGGDRAHEWAGEVPFDALPEVVNPEDGVLATANSAPEGPYAHCLTRDAMDDGRKRRIMELLEARDQLTLDDVADMHADVVSLPARIIAGRLCAGLDPKAHPELSYLAPWDGALSPESVPGAIYEVFRDQLLRRVGQDLPPRLYGLVRGQGLSEALGYLGSVFHNQGSSLVERLVTELLATEAGVELVGDAFDAAITWLHERFGPAPRSWQWGRLHQISFHHILGRAAPLLERLLHLSRGPFPVGGDADTVAQSGVDPWRPFDAATFTVSYRQIFDLGDWDEGHFILPTGQSGQPGSAHYDDMIDAWRQGRYVPLLFSAEAIHGATAGVIRVN